MLSHPFHQTIFFESNTRLFSTQLGIKIGRELAREYLKLKEVKSSRYLWTMGIWKKSPESIRIARTHPGLRKEYQRIAPNFEDSDIIGSPYAIYDYTPDIDICSSWEDLAIFREELNRHGIGLILDFVPNHLSVDTEWIDKCPEAFLEGRSNLDFDRNFFRHSSGRLLAHGKDPYYDGWTDTVQFDFSSTITLDLHLQFLDKISQYCDGLRCDMAMLPLANVFEITHQKKGLDFYWEEMIRKTRTIRKDFIFIAEVYWNLESLLQEKGFNYTYDKDLYDHLVHKNSDAISYHLQASNDYIESSLKFLENHDENRMYSTFFRDSVPFFSLIANTPGGLLIHEGQSLGLRKKIPVQFGLYPADEYDEFVIDYFNRILPRLKKRKKMPVTSTMKDVYCYESLNLYCHARIIYYEDGDREILIFNPNNQSISGRLQFDTDELRNIFPDGGVSLLDLNDGYSYVQNMDEVCENGLYFKLESWSCHWFLII